MLYGPTNFMTHLVFKADVAEQLQRWEMRFLTPQLASPLPGLLPALQCAPARGTHKGTTKGMSHISPLWVLYKYTYSRLVVESPQHEQPNRGHEASSTFGRVCHRLGRIGFSMLIA